MKFKANTVDVVRRSLSACLLASACLASAAAHGGSIVINQADPNSSLQYKDDTGRTRDLLVSWSDLQLISKVKAFLLSKHGEAGRGMPYMVDRRSQTVSVLVDRSSNRYEVVSFGELKDF